MGRDYAADADRQRNPRSVELTRRRNLRWGFIFRCRVGSMSPMSPVFIAAARRRNPQSNKNPVPSTERRLVYIIDAPATWRGVGIVAEIATEHRKLDGSWELPTSLPASAFELRGAAIETTLRHACDAERCRVRTAADERPTTSLRWDDGPPWQLRVHVAREEPEHYVITAGLHRGGVEMPIAEPALVHWEGWVIARGTIARFDFNGAFAVAALFRNAGHIAASREELSEFLTGFNALRRVPPIDLPHGVPVTEVHAAPIPTLKVLPLVPSAPPRKVRRLAMGFRYGPLEITGAERTPTVYDADTRTVHYRDFAAEAAARARLASHRAKQEPGEDAELGERSLVIPAQKLGTLVADVVRAGWQVDASGAEYRSPGPTRAIVRSGIDWFELDAGVRFGEVEVSLSELLEARRAGATSILLPDGAFGLLPLEWLARLGPLTAGGRSVGGVIRYRPSQVALLDALLGAVPEADVDATFEKARAELRTFETVSAVDAGPGFGGTLRGYQREGLGWLEFLRRFGLGGCLADDMGLGKTVQVLALLDAVLDAVIEPRDAPRRPSIVVVPRSLVFNWIREAERFAPRLRVLDFTGSARRLGSIDSATVDVVITTYGTLRRDAAALAAIRFDYAILDEAQAIKNPDSGAAKAARLLSANHRLAMTGTPIENRIEELWSLFEFLNPGMLGSASGFSELVRLTEMDDSPSGPAAPWAPRDLLARALRPVILRRTKERVAQDLPPRTEQTLKVALQGEQRAFYDGLLASYRHSLLEQVDRMGIAKVRMHVLEALLRLRQAACHAGLVDPRMIDAPSAKLDALLPRLEEITEQGHKALVFSQFTSFLALARARLDTAGIPYEYLDGQVRDRTARVDRFQSDPACPLFLISLKAGGHGLNLTAADYVFLLDPWWNPAVEAQAVDRAHRIGQTRSVLATRLVARDTVEEKILDLQATKRALADAILGQSQGGLAGIGREELEALLA
jgi:superfamily II DNA or RNA helicase